MRNTKLAFALVLPLTLAILLTSSSSSVLASTADDPSTQARADKNSPASQKMDDSVKSNVAQPSGGQMTILGPVDQGVTGQQQQPSDTQPQSPDNTGQQPTGQPVQVIGQGQTGIVKGGKGNTLAQQQCAGIQSVFECNQIVKNIHNTTVKGSNVLIGTPVTATNGATPVVLYIPGVGYVELTGIQNAGAGQATISYVVLVPSK